MGSAKLQQGRTVALAHARTAELREATGWSHNRGLVAYNENVTEELPTAESVKASHRRLVEVSRRVAIKKGDKARAKEWADVSYKRKGEILAGLLAMTAAMAKTRGGGWTKPPLMSVRARFEEARQRREE